MQSQNTEQDDDINLDAYFQSIKPAFESTLASEDLRQKHIYDGDGITVVFFLFLLFSLIPLIPALDYFASRWIRRPLTLSLFDKTFSAHTFLFWYVVCVVLSSVAFGLRLCYSSYRQKKSDRKMKGQREELLSDSHMRFALCYSARLEIEHYRTNKLNRHIEKTREYWKRFIPLLRQVFGSERLWPDPMYVVIHEGAAMKVRHRQQGTIFFPEVHTFLNDFSWFKLDETTQSIVLALDDLWPKINDRLYDKKDLYQISRCLLPLSFYLYTQIPDVADTEDDKECLKEVEQSSLLSFVGEMLALDKYSSPNKISPALPKSMMKKEKLAKLFARTVGNPSPFLRFLSMWLLIQIVLAIAVPIFLIAIKTLKFDSTLIALLLGSPLAIAAALTAIPLDKYKEPQRS